MRNQDPFQRPTAAELLRHPFFARDPFLEIMLFLQSFRAHSQEAKKVWHFLNVMRSLDNSSFGDRRSFLVTWTGDWAVFRVAICANL